MNNLENNLEELINTELIEISGGRFFYDLGVAAHHSWNSLSAGLRSLDGNYVSMALGH